MLTTELRRYKASKKKSGFAWNNIIKNYVLGNVHNRSTNLAWYKDVDTVYLPMNWGKRHWVALVIRLRKGNIFVLDPLIINTPPKKVPHLMRPVIDLLPVIVKEFVDPALVDCPLPHVFSLERLPNVYQNDRTGDCGPLAVKFIELHALKVMPDSLTEDLVDKLRMSYAVDVYQEFVVPLTN
ncbi:PREDICTED: uncharacterized protein LOC109132991 [Camelina sativa]|uniref:Uncharacterized protein LOC109132991 n=1 Tax=Camelina sativa TaxID=90675 RepID=A0ABM1RPW6_CAMSA|nr:PREDICTED: uncharacterized protein LOC109132991 [Camelina sativa]